MKSKFIYALEIWHKMDTLEILRENYACLINLNNSKKNYNKEKHI